MSAVLRTTFIISVKQLNEKLNCHVFFTCICLGRNYIFQNNHNKKGAKIFIANKPVVSWCIFALYLQ